MKRHFTKFFEAAGNDALFFAIEFQNVFSDDAILKEFAQFGFRKRCGKLNGRFTSGRCPEPGDGEKFRPAKIVFLAENAARAAGEYEPRPVTGTVPRDPFRKCERDENPA